MTNDNMSCCLVLYANINARFHLMPNSYACAYVYVASENQETDNDLDAYTLLLKFANSFSTCLGSDVISPSFYFTSRLVYAFLT